MRQEFGRIRQTFCVMRIAARPPFCEIPLKLQRNLIQLLAIRNLIVNSTEKIYCAV
jgi:hypothetical protein